MIGKLPKTQKTEEGLTYFCSCKKHTEGIKNWIISLVSFLLEHKSYHFFVVRISTGNNKANGLPKIIHFQENHTSEYKEDL